MPTPAKVIRGLKFAAFLFLFCPVSWAATTVDLSLVSAASQRCGAGSLDDWVALLFAALAGLLCVQKHHC